MQQKLGEMNPPPPVHVPLYIYYCVFSGNIASARLIQVTKDGDMQLKAIKSLWLIELQLIN